MTGYALATLRARWSGFLGAFLALCCAAAMVTACGALLETGLRGRIATERYAAAPVVVAADQKVHRTTVKEKNGKRKVKHKAKPLAEWAWLPQSAVDEVRRVPGVRAAVPELTFPARPVTADGQEPPAHGHAWSSARLTPFALTSGAAPRGAGEVVVDRELARRVGLRPGDELVVRSTGAPRAYRVSGVAAPSGGDLAHQTSLFFDGAEARRLAGRAGQVAAVGVFPEPGTDTGVLAERVRAALDGTAARVHTGDGRGAVEFPDAAHARVKLISMGGAIGGTALLVAALVVAGTYQLTVQQRHRELALLRAVAATPRQVRRLIGREALLVGLAAGLVGAVAGLPLAGWLHGRLVDLGAVPGTLELSLGLAPMAAAVLVTAFGGWASARASARRAARTAPAEALSEAAGAGRRTPWARYGAGLVLLAGGAVLLAVLSGLNTEPASTPVTFLAVVVLGGAVSLLGPLFARAAGAVLGPLLRLSRTSGHLAAANARANAARTASAIAPLALLVGMVCTVLFTQTTLGGAARAEERAGTRAAWVLAADAPGVPGAAADAARRVPGVTAVTEVVTTEVRVGLAKYSARGVTAAGLTRTWDPRVTAGTLEGFGGRDVAVSENAADRLGVRPGDTLRLTLGDGTPAALTVSAVYARGLGFGDLAMDHALVAGHVDNPLAATVLVAAEPAVARAALDRAVRPYPGVAVLSPGQALDAGDEVRRTNAEVQFLAMGLVLAFTAIAVVNTLATATADRARELALLRLVGTTRRQVLRMLRLEALVVALTGAVLGSAIALATLAAYSAGMTGTAVPRPDPLVHGLVVALAAALALAATAVPGRLALRGGTGAAAG
ncbi:FtsX-like permease family protein [Streptomyces capparidis]